MQVDNIRGYLINVSQISQVEDVVKFDGGGQEDGRHASVHCECQVRDELGALDYGRCELSRVAGQVLAQDVVVDMEQSFRPRETVTIVVVLSDLS